jgi:diazepam-binding inhibitor (GABA receptor modulator, acyl-CoA-binding protein)
VTDTHAPADVRAAFEAAHAATQDLTRRPDNATLLRLYALYKQATEGDNPRQRPGLSDLVGRAKWDAWTALKGMPTEEAMRRYTELVDTLE